MSSAANNGKQERTVTNQGRLGRRRITVIVALGAIALTLFLATDPPLPSDDLVNRPDGPVLCGRTTTAAWDYRI
jgi:hypothetical protein